MENLIKYTASYETNFRVMKLFAVLLGCACLFLACFALLRSYAFAESQKSQIYVLDQGRSLIALQSEGAATKDLEAMDHVRQFHELFFNLAPNEEVINSNKERALILSDRSAYEYWNDLAETGFFTRIVQGNITQQIVIDDIVVDVSVYPYTVRTRAKLYSIRESVMTVSDFESTCQVRNLQRSANNPHGMMIEKFRVVRNDLLETRTR